MKKVVLLALGLAFLCLVGCAGASNSTQTETTTTETTDGNASLMEKRKAMVERYMQYYETGDISMASPTDGMQVEENLSFRDICFISDLVGKCEVEVIRLIADEDAVFAQSRIVVDGSTFISFDLFIFGDNNKVERWNCVMSMGNRDPEGKYAVAGEREPKELEKTEMNKELIREFTQLGYLDFRPKEELKRFFDGENLINHDFQEDGFEWFINEIPMSGVITDEPVDDLHTIIKGKLLKIMGAGNLVVGAHIISYLESDVEVIRINLYRVENGKIVEVWQSEDTLGYVE